MKHLVNKSLSLLLIVSILISIFAINSFAAGFDIDYKKMAHHHFNNLSGNIPKNEHDSCGYVAMSMVLSFYDCYWSDIFVAHNQEGAKANINKFLSYPNFPVLLKLENDILSDTEKENETAYRAFIQNNSDDYLHMHLISLGIQNNYHPTDDDIAGFGITTKEMANILDIYFDGKFGAEDYYREDEDYDESLPVTIHIVSELDSSKTRQDVIDAINTQVTIGNPVIYRADKIIESSGGTTRSSEASDDEKVGHFMVAYFSTESGDILFHKGHTSESYSTFNTTEYNLNIEALWIEINEDVFPHSCSDNYIWYPDETPVCSCIAYKDMHPEHVHSQFYISNDETTHTYGCEWGCDDIVSPHEYASYTSYSNSLHSARCRCGYTMSESHNFQRISPRYSVCMNCGYTRDHHLGGNENVHLGTEDEEDTE